jgi:NADH:ubiquinone oxidoreductase subunit 5 (subunit L)/multisubunit Na+/H+ antiporter MnhA subunit
MPYTGLFMLLASLSISALPPFNGFVSEWLTFQSLFHYLTGPSSGTGVKLLSMLSIAALAMAGALAAACFVKFIGIAFLGLPRSEYARNAHEVPISMLGGMGFLILLCLILGLFPQLIIGPLDNINRQLLSVAIFPGMQGVSFLTYYPLQINSTGISPLAVVLLGVVLFPVCYTVIKYVGRNTKKRIYGTWDCGFGQINSKMQYTATGFSKPLRIVFRVLYRPKRELHLKEGPSPYYHNDLRYIVSTEPVIEKYIYLPLANALTRGARKAKFYVQTGSVHIYLIYIFLALIALLIYNWVC